MKGVAGRAVTMARTSRETDIAIRLDPDTGWGASVKVSTGIGFLDHLFGSLATHAGWALELVCEGDLEVDDHHSAEDCALLLGEAIAASLALGGKIIRFGYAYAPMDEALARAVVDLSGRPACVLELGLERESVGSLACENIEHVLRSLAMAARMNLHVDVLRGKNDHHRAEAAFKALALALGAAMMQREQEEQEGTVLRDTGNPKSCVASSLALEQPCELPCGDSPQGHCPREGYAGPDDGPEVLAEGQSRAARAATPVDADSSGGFTSTKGKVSIVRINDEAFEARMAAVRKRR